MRRDARDERGGGLVKKVWQARGSRHKARLARKIGLTVTAPMAHVLVVEDDRHIRDLIALHLGLEGLECTLIGDGREALDRLAGTPFDLVVLDLMLPGVDGLTLCKALRRTGANTGTPVLMLTARGEESDKVLGLESGADDYLAKPFGIREFVARVRALLRRPAPAAARTPRRRAARQGRHVHGVEIDPARRRVRVRGQEVELTAQEFELLHLLASHPGIVFSREVLLRACGRTDLRDAAQRRHAREAPAQARRARHRAPALVLTVWGAGYKFADV